MNDATMYVRALNFNFLPSIIGLITPNKAMTQLTQYGQLSPRRTPLGPALSVRLIESQIKGVKKGRDQR